MADMDSKITIEVGGGVNSANKTDGDSVEPVVENTKTESSLTNKESLATSRITDNESQVLSSRPQTGPEANHKYEVIDGEYHYTDETTNISYKFDNEKQTWVALSEKETKEKQSKSMHVDSDGRTYYYSEGQYLCRDPTGAVYYLDEKNEWVLWNSTKENINSKDSIKSSDDGKWYFYRGEDAFYRDQVTNVVYRYNKSTSSWEISKSDRKSTKRKRKSQHPDEEFDTSESSDGEDNSIAKSSDSDELLSSGLAPPGYQNDPNISFNGQVYLKEDKTDNMLYEWDITRRAWFPKVSKLFIFRSIF